MNIYKMLLYLIKSVKLISHLKAASVIINSAFNKYNN